MEKHVTKVCLNPACNAEFTDTYGGKQRVCSGSAVVDCRKCKGAGKRDGQSCSKCSGKGQIRETCKAFYRAYWASTRKPPRGLASEQLDKVKAALRRDPFHESLFAVMGESGLRKGEALGLTWDDLFDQDWTPRKVFIVRGQWKDGEGFVPTKTRAADTCYLLSWGLEAIGRHRAKAKPKDRKARIWPIAESTCWRRWKALQRKVGLEGDFRVHDLRHTAAIQVLRKTKDIRLAQQLLRHRSVATTQAYTERPDEEVRDEIDKALKRR